MVILLRFDCNLIFNQEAIHLQACLLSAVQQHEIQNLSGFTVIKIDQTAIKMATRSLSKTV